eukprot:XP_001199832.3 PREDICTED: ankyrin-3 [Strongylocentrotus purpuratus]
MTAKDEWLRQRPKSDVVWAASDDVSTEPGINKRGQTAGSGLADGKKRRLTAGYGDDNVTQRPTSKPVCAGGDTNSQAQDKATPLYIATQENYVDIVKLLLERGASPKITVEDGYLPIHVAAYKGHNQCLELLLDHYDTYTTLDCPDTPLHLAIEGGQRETVKFLIEHGFDVNTGWKLPRDQLEKVRNTRPHFLPPLTMAVMERQKDLVQDMLAIGASANCREFPPVTAYKCPFYAAFPSINILDILLKHCKGARCPHSKWTMFRVFSRSKDLEAIQFLLDRDRTQTDPFLAIPGNVIVGSTRCRSGFGLVGVNEG